MRDGEYPMDALCKECSHEYGDHGGPCAGCLETADDDEAWHSFEPLRLAGGAHSASEERAAYERAMKAAAPPDGAGGTTDA